MTPVDRMEPKYDSAVFSPCVLRRACVIGLITSVHSLKTEKSWLLNFGDWRHYIKTYQFRYLWGTYVYSSVKYLKNVLKYKYLSIITYTYLSTSTQVHKQYLSTYLSTNVLKYSSSLYIQHANNQQLTVSNSQ